MNCIESATSRRWPHPGPHGLRQALKRAGVGFRAARSLARTRPDVCLRQLLWHEDRLAALAPVGNPGGLLAQAIRDDYTPPPGGR